MRLVEGVNGMVNRVLNRCLAHDQSTFLAMHREEWIRIHRTSQLELLSVEDRIVLIGDSLIQNGEWSEMLQPLPVANRGCGGDTSRQLHERVLHTDLSHANAVIGMVGINDLLKGGEALEVAETINRTIMHLRSEGLPVAWLSILPVAPPRPDCNHAITSANDLIGTSCRDHGAHFWDVASDFAEKGRLSTRFSLDGLHLNGEGYQLLASAVRIRISAISDHL